MQCLQLAWTSLCDVMFFLRDAVVKSTIKN